MTEKPPVQDFATDLDHTDPAVGGRSLSHLGGPAPALSRRAHRSLRRRVVSRDPRGRVSTIAKDTENFTSRTVVIANRSPDRGGPARAHRRGAAHHVGPAVPRDRAQAHPAGLCARASSTRLSPRSASCATSLLDDMIGEEIVNAGAEYARLIPPAVIRQMLGFPEEDTEKFIEIVHIIIETIDHSEEERIAAVRAGGGVLRAPRSKTTMAIPATT